MDLDLDYGWCRDIFIPWTRMMGRVQSTWCVLGCCPAAAGGFDAAWRIDPKTFDGGKERSHVFVTFSLSNSSS